MTRIERLQRIVQRHQHDLIDDVLVDVQTAQVLCLVHDKLSDDNRVVFEAVPIQRLADFAWARVTSTRTTA